MAVLAGSGSRFGMGFILCLCSVLLAFSAVLWVQMQSPVQAVAIAPAIDPNARYYPLTEYPLFRIKLRRFIWIPDDVILPEPNPEILPTVDLALKIPLYPAAPSPMPAPTGEGQGDAPPAFHDQTTSDREAEMPKEEK